LLRFCNRSFITHIRSRCDTTERIAAGLCVLLPTSLVLRRFGWLEDEFKADGTSIKWVLSAGSNRALEYLNANSIDIGSSAGLAALLAKANGNRSGRRIFFHAPNGRHCWCGKTLPSAISPT
jgi:ABC-type nitrate/sulfonate/bicarbonate transport system substrate-binding protein